MFLKINLSEQTWGQFNSRIAYLKKTGIDKFDVELIGIDKMELTPCLTEMIFLF